MTGLYIMSVSTQLILIDFRTIKCNKIFLTHQEIKTKQLTLHHLYFQFITTI